MTEVRQEIYSEDELDILHEIHASAKFRGPDANVYEQIRKRIPRISLNAARRAIWDLNQPGFVDMPRSTAKDRKCMCCRKIFHSAGPENRLCSSCKSRASSSIEI